MKNLFFLVLTILSLEVYSQSGTIRGRVIGEDNLPLPGAKIITDDDKGAISDRDGFYTLLKVQEGSRTLTVTYIGFETQTKKVELTAGAVLRTDFKMEGEMELDAVVITGIIRGQAKAFNQQNSNINVTNIVAADQIGRFPDANIGDALKRIPGISVQYDQGEARFGSVRGMAPQLNSITVNGERIPSAEAEIRTIQLDLIPSDMIQTIEVNKAVTPDMDGDAIGGSINLVTRSAPYGERISVTLGGGYNPLAEKPTFNGALIYGNRFAEDKLGVIVSASYFDNNLGSDNVEAEWTYDDANDNDRFDEGEDYWPEEIQIRQYYLQRIRQSYSAALDFKPDENNTIYFKGIYNRRKDWESRYRAVYKDIEQDGGTWVGELERQTKGGIPDIKNRRLEDQEMMTFSLGGDHLLGNIELNWSGNYSKASEDRPNERYYEIATDGTVPLNLDFSDEETPFVSATEADFQNPSSAWELSEITEEFQYTEDEDINGRFDLKIPLASGKNNSFLKFGGRYRGKSKERDNNFYEYEPTSDEIFNSSIASANVESQSKDNFLPGDYNIGSFISEDFLGDLDLEGPSFEREQDLSELAGNFDATERILGTYVMLNQQIGEKLTLLAGVRLEQTNLKYSGNQFDDEEGTLTKTDEVESDYVNVLPGLHLRYAVTPRTILRFAYTNTLARPNYFDLVPYREIEDGEELSIGNPELEPTTAMNLDLMAEHYFSTIGIVSGGLFFKDISDFIVTEAREDFLFEGTTWGDFARPINGGDATVWGAEIAFQRQLDFLPGALKGLSIYGNYTYTNSEVTDFNFDGRENDELALPGSPDHTFNLSLAYERGKFTSRISYNYASDFIDEVGSEAFSDRFYDAVNYLDVNLSYQIVKNWVLYVNANNLLNQPLRYYQGVSRRTMQAEYYNARFDLGVKLDLFRK
ncbi:MAG: TonB-dependent receptor [Bacteroidota bacterium]